MSKQWHGGKGSKPRPYSVDSKTFETNWDNIFKKSPQEIDDAKAEDDEFKLIEDRMKNETGKI